VNWLWWLDATLGVLASACFFVWLNDGWDRLTTGVRALRVACLALLVSVSYGAGEAYMAGSMIGLRTFLVAASLFGIVGSIAWIYTRD
jgi:hypothetical protein